jgi:Lysylphosphatidylglycerol synthase TM region
VPIDGEEPAATPRRADTARRLDHSAPRRLHITGVVSAVLGVALFTWYVRGVGPSEIWGGLRSVGWGFVVIITITGLRFALRAAALTLCFEPPHQVPFRSVFTAVLAGDALGNLTPLGLIASEPTKAAFVRQHVPLGPALTAVAIETILYTSTVAAMIGATTLALLLSVDLPQPMRHAAAIAVAAIALGFVLAAWLLWKRPAIVGRLVASILPARSSLQSTVARLHDLEQQIYTFAIRRRDVLAPVLGAELAFHALGVLEIYVTLWLILPAGAPWLTAFILEGANRLVQVVFKPVPLRAGVDEVTTGTFTRMLGYGATLGATLAIVRKVRTVFWVLVGTLLLVRRGVTRR